MQLDPLSPLSSLPTLQFSALRTSRTADHCHHSKPQHTQLQKARGSLRSKSQAHKSSFKTKAQTGNNKNKRKNNIKHIKQHVVTERKYTYIGQLILYRASFSTCLENYIMFLYCTQSYCHHMLVRSSFCVIIMSLLDCNCKYDVCHFIRSHNIPNFGTLFSKSGFIGSDSSSSLIVSLNQWFSTGGSRRPVAIIAYHSKHYI